MLPDSHLSPTALPTDGTGAFPFRDLTDSIEVPLA